MIATLLALAGSTGLRVPGYNIQTQPRACAHTYSRHAKYRLPLQSHSYSSFVNMVRHLASGMLSTAVKVFRVRGGGAVFLEKQQPANPGTGGKM